MKRLGMVLVAAFFIVVLNGTSQAQVATGSYTGNATAGTPITVGFQPDVVIIKGDGGGGSAVLRTSTMTGDNSKPMGTATALTANLVQSLDANGFTIGSDTRVNQSGISYHWVAFKANTNLKVGTYTGNGTSQSITGVGFSPEYLIVASAGANNAQQKASTFAATRAYDFTPDAGATTRITSLDADGFSVGNSTTTNTNTTVYYYVAWNAVAGKMAVGTYTGNGISQSISGVGFLPAYVIVKNHNTTTARRPLQKPKTLADPKSLTFDLVTTNASTGITALQSDGFQVGSAVEANENTQTITYVAFAQVFTAVDQISFDATQAGGQTLLKWQTGYEVNNLGFNLYRERNGKRTRINPSIIAGSAFLAGPGTAMTAGDSYSWVDPQGSSDSVYYLEDVDLNGVRSLNGPIAPVASKSPGTITGYRQALLLSQLNAQADSASGISKWQKGWPAYTGEGRELLYNIDAKPSADLQSLIAAHGAVKLSVNREGWYRVTQADLAAAGFDEQVDARMLQLYVGGVQVPILMNAARQQFLAGDSFEFYGAGLDTPTTDTNTYWLVIGNGKGLRILPAARPPTSAQTESSVTAQPSQSQNGTGQTQGIQASPSSASPQTNRQGWFVVPMIIPSTTKEDTTKPKDDDNGVPAEAQPSTTPIKNSSENVAAPVRKSKRTKARTKRSRLKASSHNHAMLRPAAVESYPYTVELREKIIYASSILNGDADNFYGQAIASVPVNEKIYLSNLRQSAGETVKLEAALQGLTTVDHQVKVKLNGQEVGALSFAGQEHAVTELSAPSSLLLEGQNTVTFERAGGDTDVTLVDYIRLTYEHSYRADDNFIRFTAAGSTRLDGFSYNNVRVMDISDPLHIKQLSGKVETTAQGFAVTVQAPRSDGEYIAFTDNATSRPASISQDKASDLKSGNNGADLVIISNNDFIPSVQPLAELRRHQGLRVSVVDVEDIFDEFSSGSHTPYAIKDFLSWTQTHWHKSPQFVLLVGDGSLDPRNYQGNGVTDFVPTKLIDASTMETASDDWLADFNNDGVAEMALGRLPVRTKAEAERVINKITGYTPGNAQQQVLMVVDRNNASDTFSFAQTGAELSALLPSSISVNTINRGNSSDDAALHSQVVSAINQGPLVVNYLGHGSVEVWTGAPILSATDTSALNNANHLPVFVMMTCLNGYFANPSRDSLAEALMRNNTNGAVAVWASSGMTQANAQAQMNKELYKQVFNTEGLTLGEAVEKAKESTGDLDVRRTWILFGDPAMKLR
jgi:hypothetical protein